MLERLIGYGDPIVHAVELETEHDGIKVIIVADMADVRAGHLLQFRLRERLYKLTVPLADSPFL